MGQRHRLTVRFDDDVHDHILERHNETNEDKARIINKQLREAFTEEEQNAPTLGDTVLPVFGQGLFVVGLVFGLLAASLSGFGMSAIGIALIVGAKADEYSTRHGVPATTALVKVLKG